MGSGKGTPEYWVGRIHPGRIMFEIDGVPRDYRRGGLRTGGGEAVDEDALRDPPGRGGLSDEDPGSSHQEPGRAEGRADGLEEGGVQPALPARPADSSRTRRACARCGATSRASRPCLNEGRRVAASDGVARNAEANPAGRGGERQDATRRSSSRSSAASCIRSTRSSSRRSKKYAAHDEANRFKIGETVSHPGVPADLQAQALGGGDRDAETAGELSGDAHP